MLKPWQTVSKEQIKCWIKEAAMVHWVTGDFEDWFSKMRLIDEQWTQEACDEFLRRYNREIVKVERFIDDWLESE